MPLSPHRYEVAFLEAPESGWEPLFVIDRIVDCVFIVDIGLQFFLAYRSGGQLDGARWITDHKQIVKHYLRTWFVPDLLSVSVSVFDIISLLDNNKVSLAWLRAQNSSQEGGTMCARQRHGG